MIRRPGQPPQKSDVPGGMGAEQFDRRKIRLVYKGDLGTAIQKGASPSIDVNRGIIRLFF